MRFFIRLSIMLLALLLWRCAEGTPKENYTEKRVLDTVVWAIDNASDSALTKLSNSNSSVPEPLQNDLKWQLTYLDDYNYDDDYEVDADSLARILSLRLTNYLKTNDLSAEASDSLGLKISIDEPNLRNIKVFNFGFHSGGTRGIISHPIMQWKGDSGELNSYNLCQDISCFFYEIWPLDSDFGEYYLLLGQESGSGACLQNIAYCIEIRDRKLIADQIFFVNRPYINLCNITFEFNEETKVLKGIDEYDLGEDIAARVKEQGVYSQSENDNEALVGLLDGLYSDQKTILLQFNGREFEKFYPNNGP